MDCIQTQAAEQSISVNSLITLLTVGDSRYKVVDWALYLLNNHVIIFISAFQVLGMFSCAICGKKTCSNVDMDKGGAVNREMGHLMFCGCTLEGLIHLTVSEIRI